MYTGLSAVIGSWKITETSTAADLAQRPLVDADELPAVELDRARTTWQFFGSSPISDIAVVDLPGPGLADDRQHLAGVEVEPGVR